MQLTPRGNDLASVDPGFWVRIVGFRTDESRSTCAHVEVHSGDEVLCHAVQEGSVAVERSDGWCVTLDATLAREVEVAPLGVRKTPETRRPLSAL